MHVLIIFGHPEHKSLNGSLLKETITHLTKQGHDVKVTDLYSQDWKSNLDCEDTPMHMTPGRFFPMFDLGISYQNGKLPQDILKQQEVVKWADVLLFQFPMWWYSMPAAMKGWFDRVLVYGFAYSTTPEGKSVGLLEGKKAMILATLGGGPDNYSEHGETDAVENLFLPITKSIAFCGIENLKSHYIYRSISAKEEDFPALVESRKSHLEILNE